MDLREELGNLADEELNYAFERSKVMSNRKACQRAGISESTFYSWPEEKRDHLNELAQKLKRDRIVAANMVLMESVEEYARRLSDQALLSLDDFVDIGADGLPVLNLEKARERGKLHLVRELWQDSDGRWRVKFHDAQKAVESALDRTIGKPTQRLEHTGEGGEPIRFTVGGLDLENDV